VSLTYALVKGSTSPQVYVIILLQTYYERRESMSLQAHLSELAAKHQALEAELAEALAHPASTDAEIAELKRRKLKLKDEISRIENQVNAA
jgi:hypothetical protein